MAVSILQGDLLDQRVDAIVNTVNCVGVMGKGIALQFKRKWPANFKAYEAACKAGQVVPGKMFVFDAGGLLRPRYIINFPTKRHWRGPSNLGFIEAGLLDLAEQIPRLGIRSIALPPLGCGNGGLRWDDVRPRIEAALGDIPNLDVRLFEPANSEPLRELARPTAPVRMTPSRAAVLSVLAAYRALSYPLSRIEVQKLAYFLEQAGEPLDLAFVRHTFGPYSAKLRHVLTHMDGTYITGLGDYSHRSQIRVVDEALEKAHRFLREDGGGETMERVDRVASTIDGFQTPYGMELLATVHWAALDASVANGFKELVGRIYSWSARKRNIMSERDIAIAAERLVEDRWLEPSVIQH